MRFMEAHPKPKYSLAELLAQCDPTVAEDPEERAWQDMEAVGSEAFLSRMATTDMSIPTRPADPSGQTFVE